MKRQFPYKTIPCPSCTPATRDNCETCFGSGRDIELIERERERERDKATLRKALDDVFAAGRALGRAVGLR